MASASRHIVDVPGPPAVRGPSDPLSLGDNGNSQGGEASKSPQECRCLSILCHIQDLVHACQCNTNCSLPSCQKMKMVVQHNKVCTRKTNGGCPVCKQLIALCCYHAQHCQDNKCPVPFCLNIKHAQIRRRSSSAQPSPMSPQTHLQPQAGAHLIGPPALANALSNQVHFPAPAQSPCPPSQQPPPHSSPLQQVQNQPQPSPQHAGSPHPGLGGPLSGSMEQGHMGTPEQSAMLPQLNTPSRGGLNNVPKPPAVRGPPDPLGLDDDSNSQGGEASKRPQESRRLSIQRCIESLVHTCHCCNVNCSLPSCQRMKRLVQHNKVCKRKTKGGCPVCKQLIALCCYHAKHCQDNKCPVPFCLNIKHAQMRRRRRSSSAQPSPMSPQTHLQPQAGAHLPGPPALACLCNQVRSPAPA